MKQNNYRLVPGRLRNKTGNFMWENFVSAPEVCGIHVTMWLDLGERCEGPEVAALWQQLLASSV